MHITQEFMYLLKAGRYLLAGVSQGELAQRAGISRKMLLRIENADPSVPSRALDQIQVALEGMGVMFIPSPDTRTPCVARRKTKAEVTRQTAETQFERRRTLRAARELVDLTQESLAKKSGLTRREIIRVEAGTSSAGSVDKVVGSLENSGVQFVQAGRDHWSGVAFRKR